MNKLILGIDPGLTGAFALLAPDGQLVALEDLPVIRDGSLAWIDGNTLMGRVMQLRNGCPTVAVVERVSPMPKNGTKGNFSQGLTLGSILAQLQAANCGIEFVAPQTWKRGLGLIFTKEMKDTERKHRSLDKARVLYPGAELHRVKDHGRAEALLIAHWFINRQPQRAAA